MKECSKSIPRRLADSNFISKYFVGIGVDIGGKPDPLSLYADLFVRMTSVKTWDWEDGDAQLMEGVADNCMDFVHSSHCLEHLVNPHEGLKNWFRILRPGGYLIVTVPDEDLYEQGVFPSTFNRDHKWTFTIKKTKSWSDRSINVMDMLAVLAEDSEVLKIELLTSTYRYSLPRFDQNLSPVGECGIEFIVRKRMSEQMTQRENTKNQNKINKELLTHLNQYLDDHKLMKNNNLKSPPFANDNIL